MLNGGEGSCRVVRPPPFPVEREGKLHPSLSPSLSLLVCLTTPSSHGLFLIVLKYHGLFLHPIHFHFPQFTQVATWSSSIHSLFQPYAVRIDTHWQKRQPFFQVNPGLEIARGLSTSSCPLRCEECGSESELCVSRLSSPRPLSTCRVVFPPLPPSPPPQTGAPTHVSLTRSLSLSFRRRRVYERSQGTRQPHRRCAQN